ncbi:unnamed protein product [Didymodactylos carnosus]|uniref:SPRY domain-containing protein n=1 Tax=Didymodactylos carnosus TaxID=1234261 RepID=A0A815EY53_9BILA|nr:unnamed protein product [Didymodactylos carnosus]CAF1316289.1 unnamed protein product [Didymodactylos carnosus]CAF4057644.1 unnamed protein product [Didymodactylos carnosus]CAF4158352.1 unnamed protein product [Didymodactylos carnosus]
MGWATEGLNPYPWKGRGVRDDEYSWSYDGSRGTLYHNVEGFFEERTRWTRDDACGCGTEINGDNTVIEIWLNGEYLDTAFRISHILLRDFVNEQHIPTTLTSKNINTQHKKLKLKNTGIVLSIDMHVYNETFTAFTISFDFDFPKDKKMHLRLKKTQFSRKLFLFIGKFDSNLWKKKKKNIDIDESKYFKVLSTDTVTDTEYAIRLFGNNSYLILEKTTFDENLNEHGKTETKSVD